MIKESAIDSLMTQAEREAVVVSVIRTRNDPKGVPEGDLIAALDWANGVRMDALMLNMVIDGQLVVDIREGGEAMFSLPRK